jgi:hypothetical protein
LICISFIVKDVDISPCVYWPFVFSASENSLFSSFPHLVTELCVLLLFGL